VLELFQNDSAAAITQYKTIPITVPGRLASAGASFRWERLSPEQRPPRPAGVVAISPPPAMIMSASPY